jgi:hypothetical protein
MKLTIRPVTPDLWPALELLFGDWGASNGCWCMYWRRGGAYRGRREQNKESLRLSAQPRRSRAPASKKSLAAGVSPDHASRSQITSAVSSYAQDAAKFQSSRLQFAVLAKRPTYNLHKIS